MTISIRRVHGASCFHSIQVKARLVISVLLILGAASISFATLQSDTLVHANVAAAVGRGHVQWRYLRRRRNVTAVEALTV